MNRCCASGNRAEDLQRVTAELAAERARVEAEIAARTADLQERHAEVLAEPTVEFQVTVADFGIPGGQDAAIDQTSYLPTLGGRPFSPVSRAGGIATATQMAYWLSLITVAARRQDCPYPAFLLMDSPRLALNTAADIAGQMYHRFVTQVGVAPGRLQFILADNQLAATYGREFTQLELSYQRPTIATVSHPGPARVKPLIQAG